MSPSGREVLGQQIFLNFTASSETFFDGRRVPSPSGVSAAEPGSSGFFGRGEQAFFDQTLRFSFDLFHGDASFKPVDWRIRITPELSLNDLDVRELGIVSPDVRRGTNRFDDHLGLQEAFVEVKLHDLSHNYDFISVRAGIQQFNADFRGFLFVDEQPGLRIFGNLDSDRIEYNAAYFQIPRERYQQRPQHISTAATSKWCWANVYLQDFFFPGYTAEFVGAWNKDDPSVHYDDNGFLVRPAPIGNVINQGPGGGPLAHGIRVGYFGWLGSGHIRPHQSHARFLSGRRRRHLQSHRRAARHRQRADGRRRAFLRPRLDSLSRFHFLYFRRRQSARRPRARFRFHRRSSEFRRRHLQLLESRSHSPYSAPAFCSPLPAA